MTNNLFVDISYKQRNYADERICGDTFVHKRIHSDNRTVIVLSDGMGHGVKANVLSTLTSSMMVNFASAKEDICQTARIVLNNLPVCSVRKISYSTFTVIDIDHRTREVTIAEHDNPQSIIFRGGSPLPTEWDCLLIGKNEARLQTILTTHFKAQEGDRVVLMTDGVTQSGLGSDMYPFGWGHENVSHFIENRLSESPAISSCELATDVLDAAAKNDNGPLKDDITCVVIHMRKPRRLLLASCPPSDRRLYRKYTETVAEFEGRKILCGYPIAEIFATETGKEIIRQEQSADNDIPPVWNIDGIDLTTEGLTTINKVFDLLDNRENLRQGQGGAYEMCRMLMDSDEIHIMMGSKQGGSGNIYFPDEFELRRRTLTRIGDILETKYMKDVNISLI